MSLELSEVEIRAALDEAVDDAMARAEEIARIVTARSFDADAVVCAAALLETAQVVRRLKRALHMEIAG